MDNLFYTYAYLREDGSPYYIGKGKGGRAFVRRGRKVHPPAEDRILILKRNLTEEEAFKHEIYMIALYGRKDIGTGILYNFTDGGEGGSGRLKSEKWREAMREKIKGNSHNNKKVKVIHPDGKETIYPSGLIASQDINVDASCVTRWARRGFPIRQGAHKGFQALYVEDN
jgi:hypothetical protein